MCLLNKSISIVAAFKPTLNSLFQVSKLNVLELLLGFASIHALFIKTLIKTFLLN